MGLAPAKKTEDDLHKAAAAFGMGPGPECGFILAVTAVTFEVSDPSHRWDDPRFVGVNETDIDDLRWPIR